jgi:iron complex transport system substrate-binding protein
VKYIRNDSVSSILEKNEIKELCLTESVQIESLLDCNPELFFNYPFGKTEQKGFAENGVQTLYIAEYLEQTQLARLEWIKLFGLLFNKVEEANAYFERVEDNYLSLRQKSQSTNKKFIMNLPFGDSWFMPSSKSVGVEVIRDAGLDYYYQREEGTENQIHTQEQVWNDGIYADYWVIIADRPVGYGLEDLLAEREVYAEFKAVKEQQVIMCNIAEVDYFASGVVEPDVLLRDMLFHTHQISDHQPKYFFRLE